MADFGSGPESNNAPPRKAKQAENFGIMTIELPNGQRVDGYILLSEKNLPKLFACSVVRPSFARFFSERRM